MVIFLIDFFISLLSAGIAQQARVAASVSFKIFRRDLLREAAKQLLCYANGFIRCIVMRRK